MQGKQTKILKINIKNTIFSQKMKNRPTYSCVQTAVKRLNKNKFICKFSKI